MAVAFSRYTEVQRTLARQMFSTIRENISPAIAAAAFVFIAGTILIMNAV
ncbi:hypothetical protein [Rhizobium sullae]|nr:hypothetical protein [Rhizobium sullae]